MTTPISVARWAATVLVLFSTAVGACGTNAPRQVPTTTQTDPGTRTMRIEITVNGELFRGTLHDSAASRALLAQLPTTVNMVDHGSVEKTGPLRTPLLLEGQPAGADPDVGDIGYYAPGNDLVLYYGDQSYFDGIVILGRMDGDAAQRLSEMSGPVTAEIIAPDATP